MGGLTTKIHLITECGGWPLAMVCGPWQGGDSPIFDHVLDAVQVDRVGPGLPRTTPDAVLADKVIATRYDKHNANYCGAVLLRNIVL